MAARKKMAAVILLNLVVIIKAAAHNEAGEFFPELSGASTELEVTVVNNAQRRNMVAEPGRNSFRATTTTTVATTQANPPLDPRYRRIYNPDERAAIDDYPFMAAILVNRELWCGAAVIDRDRIITAAHCLQLQYNNRFFREYVKMVTVRVGSANATSGGEVLKVVEINFHPNYKPSTLEFNVAVLRVHKNMTFDKRDPFVQRLLVSRDNNLPVDNNITFLGWGSVLGGGGVGGQVLLQKLEMPIYDLSDCQSTYGRNLVTRNNFCAGFITILKNVCNHDAGGPAIMDGKLVGLLSFSSRRCDLPDQPAVFTTMGPVADWLDSLNHPKPKYQTFKTV